MLMRTFIAAAAILFTGAALAESESVTFELKNATSQAIVELYASPANKDDWEDEILGGSTLNPGDTGNLTIDDGARTCKYDLKAVFKDGEELEKSNLNFCELEKLHLHRVTVCVQGKSPGRCPGFFCA